MKYTDDQILSWARMARDRGGSFIETLATAILFADYDNYQLLRSVAEQFVEKYPKYLEWAVEEEAKNAMRRD